jgi:hypothetical protein
LPIRGAERHLDLSGFDSNGGHTGGWTSTEIEALEETTQGLIEGFYTNHTIQVLMLEPTQRLGVFSFVSGELLPAIGGERRGWSDIH